MGRLSAGATMGEEGGSDRIEEALEFIRPSCILWSLSEEEEFDRLSGVEGGISAIMDLV